MVLLFNAVEFVVWSVFFLIIFVVLKVIFKKTAELDKRETNNSSEKIPGTLTFRVYEKPKITTESFKDDKKKCSTSISSNVEEINLVITEGDNGLSVDIQSVKYRGSNSEKIVFLDNIDENKLYPVTIPPDAGEVNLIIKETDHKISVEIESVKKKE